MNEFISQFHTQTVCAVWPGMALVPTWIPFAVAYAVGGALILGWMAFMALAWTYGERRIAGYIQVRYGPNRVGWQGLLQPVADALKLLQKEDIVPAAASKLLYSAAPILVFLGAMIPFAVLPFSERILLTNIELALYYILAFQAIEVIGILMAGWGPNSKWSLYGGMRLAAQMLSYEIPMGLCVLVIILLSGSLNLGEIVLWQSQNAFGLENPWIFGWAIFRSPAAFMWAVLRLPSARRSTCPKPKANWSPGTTPSTPVCASRSFSCPSTRPCT